MDDLPAYGEHDADSQVSEVSLEGSYRGRWVAASVVGVLLVLLAVSVFSGGGEPAVVLNAPTSTTPSANDPSATTATPTSTTAPATTSSVPVSTGASTPESAASGGSGSPTPNEGIDAWVFAVGRSTITRLDLLTGATQVVDTDADLAPGRANPFGRVTLVGNQLVVVGADQILLVDVDTLDVGALREPSMTLLGAGADAIWTTTGNLGTGTRDIHRVPVDGRPIDTVEMQLAVPFPFLVAAPQSDGLLVSELLGATWFIGDDGSVVRRDDISALLAAGDEAYLATSCAPNAMLCNVSIHAADGSQRGAVLTNDFSFGAPMSPDGRWLAGAGGFIDLETGTRQSRTRGLAGTQLGSWSHDSRWFVEQIADSLRLHDLTGEFATMIVPGVSGETELQLILR